MKKRKKSLTSASVRNSKQVFCVDHTFDNDRYRDDSQRVFHFFRVGRLIGCVHDDGVFTGAQGRFVGVQLARIRIDREHFGIIVGRIRNLVHNSAVIAFVRIYGFHLKHVLKLHNARQRLPIRLNFNRFFPIHPPISMSISYLSDHGAYCDVSFRLEGVLIVRYECWPVVVGVK